jgi:hypothetical protein
MYVAFIATINLDDLSDLAGLAEEIEQTLGEAGFEVKSVAPWARPSLVQTGALPMSQNQQQTTNQNIIQ